MELPMQQEATPQPTTPQQPSQPSQQGEQQELLGEDTGKNNPFPSSLEEEKKFSNDILQVLYDDRTHDNIVKQLSKIDGNVVGHGLGMVASGIIGDRIGDINAKTGRQIEMKLVVDAVSAIIPELAEIAKSQDAFEATEEQLAQATDESIKILDEMGRG